MISASIFQDLEFNDQKVAVKVLFETNFTKELRIAMQPNQQMKEHQTPFPIVVELVQGQVIFGVEGKEYALKAGDLLSLEGGVPHHLTALEQSIIRLTLSKSDTATRVKKVTEK